MMSVIMFYINGNSLLPQQVRENCLVPLCGEQTSYEVIINLMYQIFAAGYNKKARHCLINMDDNMREYIKFDDFGVYIKVYCLYNDSFCAAHIVECRKSPSQPA